MALLACGANESYDAYLAALERHVTERYAEQGTLDALMATEYSRTILTVSMLGGDPSAFGTRPDGTAIDLLNDGVWNFAGELGAQGLNGLIFALLAVDAGTYPEPEQAKNTRAGIVEAIRAAQEPDGGFGLVSGASEADLTAMALQALAPYGRDETVEATGENMQYEVGISTGTRTYLEVTGSGESRVRYERDGKKGYFTAQDAPFTVVLRDRDQQEPLDTMEFSAGETCTIRIRDGVPSFAR